MKAPQDAMLPVEEPADVGNFFRALGKVGVRYALIRRNPDSPWDLRGDVDALVHPADEERAHDVLMSLGLVRVPKQPRGTGTFFRGISSVGLLTIHVQSSIHYGGSSPVFLDGFAPVVLESAVVHGGISYASPDMNRRLVAGKIKYDKVAVSPKYGAILGGPGSAAELAEEFDTFVKDRGIVERREGGGGHTVVARWVRVGARLVAGVVSNQHIALFGVDGTGKSTLARNLHRALCGRPRIQYMGEKDWITSLARTALTDRSASGPFWRRALAPFALYVEMWSRYIRASARAGIVVFDRYPSELHVRMRGLRRVVYRILFRVLFPQPRHQFYLTCSASASVRRKDDLRAPDVTAKLVERKRQFDLYFQGRPRVGVVDTEHLDEGTIVKRVLGRLPSTMVTRL